MRKQALWRIHVAGVDVSEAVRPYLHALQISDRAGDVSDYARIELEDSRQEFQFPRHNSEIGIELGWWETGLVKIFSGRIDELRHSGGRNGSMVMVSARGLDMSGRAKEPQKRHFDHLSIEEMLVQAGAAAGITDIRVDPELGAITRDYELMEDESFAGFGSRLARELGGTFRIRGQAALLAKRNAARSVSGKALPEIKARYGSNLISWDIAPFIGRQRYRQIRVRYYDPAAARHEEVVLETGIEGSEAAAIGRFQAASRERAEEKARALKTESEREAGLGSIEIDGNPFAQPEALCWLIGARQGVDGAYLIDGVDHRYSRSSGFITRLSLGARQKERAS